MKTRARDYENHISNIRCTVYRERLIVRVPYQEKLGKRPRYFYKSTGQNSGQPGMWFPCCGIQSRNGKMKKGWIKKPSGGWYYMFSMAKKIGKMTHETRNIVERMGSDHAILVSWMVGGNIRNNQEVQKIVDLIKDNIHVGDYLYAEIDVECIKHCETLQLEALNKVGDVVTLI